jgi:hypothetical protein
MTVFLFCLTFTGGVMVGFVAAVWIARSELEARQHAMEEKVVATFRNAGFRRDPDGKWIEDRF